MKIPKKILSLSLSLMLMFGYTLKVNALSDIGKIQGKDRYETAAKIAENQDCSTVILINADNSLADGLSASGLSGFLNAPILLTHKDSMPESTRKIVEQADTVYPIGGENSISFELTYKMERLGKNEIGAKKYIFRIAGRDRIETSRNVVTHIQKYGHEKDREYNNKHREMVIANAYSEADAMSIAPFCAKNAVPILLTDGKTTIYDFKNYNNKIVYAIGGTNSVSESLVKYTNATRIGGKDRFETNQKIINKFYPGVKDFYITKSHNLVDALTGSTIAKDTPIILVNSGSNKEILKDANSITALGGLDDNVLQECIDTANNILNDSSIVYITPNGKSYHKSKDCVSLKRSDIVSSMSLKDAKVTGKTDPCNLCIR